MADQWRAGERIVADKLSKYAGEPEIREANNSTFTTTETVQDTITVPVVDGRRYKIVWDGMFFSSVAGDLIRAQLREDSVSGTVLQLRQTSSQLANQGFQIIMQAFWTATATEDKTFVATGDRISGTGNVTAVASGAPTLFYVENA